MNNKERKIICWPGKACGLLFFLTAGLCLAADSFLFANNLLEKLSGKERLMLERIQVEQLIGTLQEPNFDSRLEIRGKQSFLASKNAELIYFLQNIVIPSRNYLSMLMLEKEKTLVGLEYRGKMTDKGEETSWRIGGVNERGVRLEIVSDKGSISVERDYQNLPAEVSRKVFADVLLQGTPDRMNQRCFLATMLFSGKLRKDFEGVCLQLGEEGKTWMELAEICAGGRNRRGVLNKICQILERADSYGPLDVHDSSLELLDDGTGLSGDEELLLQRLVNICAEYTPGCKAGKLVRQGVEELSKGNSERAFQMLKSAQIKYCRQKYPEVLWVPDALHQAQNECYWGTPEMEEREWPVPVQWWKQPPLKENNTYLLPIGPNCCSDEVAEALFVRLCKNINENLKTGDIDAACLKINEAAEWNYPAFLSYYSRVLILQAGIRRLQGCKYAFHEAAEWLKISAMRQKEELLLLEIAEKPLGKADESEGVPEELVPWQAWLRKCASQANGVLQTATPPLLPVEINDGEH